MENKTTEIARYEGTIYGLVLTHREESYQPYAVHMFNSATATSHGYLGGLYRGEYLDTFTEAHQVFTRRVASLVAGAMAEHDEITRKQEVA
tara:strand:+ start:794 stop:1066 length:273 start_codon:yes stop_codon:yes gene_type:complete